METAISPSAFAAIPSQCERLAERHLAKSKEIFACGLNVSVFGGVYGTSGDTELLAETVSIGPQETFLEIGCGTGAVSLSLAKRSLGGIGVDINECAVANSRANAEALHIQNVQFFRSDVFEQVKGTFDVIACNPPYTDHPAHDDIDKMFWDERNEMKERFFREAGSFLNPGGRIFFAWANFADLDANLPIRLANTHQFEIANVTERLSPRGSCTFFVLELKKKK
ncbi:MAG TPA: class I SAM-dependent methyltransferase [Patescibacteria group bacterium]|nr:class I SAM-dependent methyltransferase [Patescibacteria group bacterium]